MQLLDFYKLNMFTYISFAVSGFQDCASCSLYRISLFSVSQAAIHISGVGDSFHWFRFSPWAMSWVLSVKMYLQTDLLWHSAFWDEYAGKTHITRLAVYLILQRHVWNLGGYQICRSHHCWQSTYSCICFPVRLFFFLPDVTKYNYFLNNWFSSLLCLLT